MTLSLTDVSRAASERVRKCQEWLAFVQFLVFIYSGYMAPTSSISRTIARSDTVYLFRSTYPPREKSRNVARMPLVLRKFSIREPVIDASIYPLPANSYN